jgi:hypothetical protein
MKLFTRIPLFVSIVQREPELLSPAAVVSRGSVRVAEVLRYSGATADDEDLLSVAELIFRVTISYCQFAGTTIDTSDDESISRFAERFFVPLVESALSS